MNKQESELAIMLGKAFPDLPIHTLAQYATTFARLARTSQRFAELACNRELSATERRTDEATDRALRDLAEGLRIRIKLDGDPRGYVVKLFISDPKTGRLFYNTMGGEEAGWGI